MSNDYMNLIKKLGEDSTGGDIQYAMNSELPIPMIAKNGYLNDAIAGLQGLSREEMSGPQISRSPARYTARPASIEDDFYTQLKDNLARRNQRTSDLESELDKANNADVGGMGNMDLSNVFGAINNIYGTNYGQGYKAPTAKAEKANMIAGIKSRMDKNDSGLADNQLSYLKLLADGQYRKDQMSLDKMKLSQSDNPYTKEKLKKLGAAGASWIDKDRPTFIANSDKLDVALNKLDEARISNSNLFGNGKGLIPDTIRAFTNEDAITVRDSVQSAITDTLRPTLGAQFTENEGKRIMNMAINPNLSDEENQRRISELQKVIAKKVEATDALHAYIAETGSDVGFPFERFGMRKGGTSNTPSGDQNQAALEWAKANPNDPRASAILKKIGVN